MALVARTACLVSLLGILIFQLGCSTQTPVRVPRSAVPVASVDLAEFTDQAQSRNNEVQQYRALVRGSITHGSSRDTFRYAVTCREEGFRVELLAPGAAYAVGVLGVRGNQFRYFDATSNSYSEGVANSAAMMQHLRMPVEPAELCSYLVGRVGPIWLSDLSSGNAQVLSVGVRHSSQYFLKSRSREDFLELHHVESRLDGLITRAVVVDRFNEIPRVDIRYSWEGGFFGRLQNPSRLNISLPQDQVQIELTFASFALGARVDTDNLLP